VMGICYSLATSITNFFDRVGWSRAGEWIMWKELFRALFDPTDGDRKI
jgi:hypothetical protein